MEYSKSSKWPVLNEDGIHVGDIIRQHGSTLWSLQRKGMERPFKKDIPSLDAAKALAVNFPQVWSGDNFDPRRSLINTGAWLVILAALYLAIA